MSQVSWGFSLDHVNIRTAALGQMIAYYEGVVGLRNGPRPPFDFPGAWLYAGERAVVHLIGLQQPPGGSTRREALRLEHFALRAGGGADLRAFLAHLEKLGIAGDVVTLPDGSAVQVNLFDPDGNHIHLDFAPPAGWKD
jgi:catechol-2,3-dioxygenase